MVNVKGFSDQKLRRLDEEAENHVWNNRSEIEKSEMCMCIACFERFPPQKVTIWQGGKSAVCPNPECGLGGRVLGSASGLNLEDYDYSSGTL